MRKRQGRDDIGLVGEHGNAFLALGNEQEVREVFREQHAVEGSIGFILRADGNARERQAAGKGPVEDGFHGFGQRKRCRGRSREHALFVGLVRFLDAHRRHSVGVVTAGHERGHHDVALERGCAPADQRRLVADDTVHQPVLHDLADRGLRRLGRKGHVGCSLSAGKPDRPFGSGFFVCLR